MGDTLGNHKWSKSALENCANRSARKTNQYGLTSDTVEQFNVVLPVSPPHMAR